MPDSVAKRLKAAIITRLQAIDGTGDFVNDVGSRVYPSRVIDENALPSLCVFRVSSDYGPRQGEERTDRAITFQVEGYVATDATRGGDVAEDMLADMERALELTTDDYDPYIKTGATRADGAPQVFLSGPLTLTDPVADAPEIGASIEVVQLGVVCTHPHKYGDPSHVYD